jgi:hypothetical protein
VNPNARKRLTDATVLIIEGLIATEGRQVPGGVAIVIPHAVARNVHLAAHDVLQHKARKARLDTAPSGAVRDSGGNVVAWGQKTTTGGIA